MAVLERLLQLLAQALLMQVVEVVLLTLAVRLVLVALEVVALVGLALGPQQQVQQTLAVAVAVRQVLLLEVKAVQASSSFHTQAQPNYSVVELLPNQAVTSFTHSHLLAHLALCHL